MKKQNLLLLLSMFLILSVGGFAQVKQQTLETKADHNSTRSNQAGGIAKPVGDGFEVEFIESDVKANYQEYRKEQVLLRKKERLTEEQFREEMKREVQTTLKNIFPKGLNHLNNNSEAQKLGGIEIEIRFRRFTIIIRF